MASRPDPVGTTGRQASRTLPQLKFGNRHAAMLEQFGASLKNHLVSATPDSVVAALAAGNGQSSDDLRRAGAAPIIEAYLQFGLGHMDGHQLVPLFQAALIDGFVVFSDLGRSSREIRRNPAFAEYVDPLWEGPIIANLISPTRCQQALDMGCGSGVLALALARSSDHVIATDVNPRALSQTRFNALLNGASNVEVRRSDLFSDLDGDRFDRIAFNAPVGLEFRPSNFLEAGEDILQAFFEQVHDHLTPDGRCWVNICAKDYARSVSFDRLRSWMGAMAGEYRLLFLEQWRMQRGVKFRARQLAARLFFPAHGRLRAIKRGVLCMQRAPDGACTEYRTHYFDWARALGRDASAAFVDWALAHPAGDLAQNTVGAPNPPIGLGDPSLQDLACDVLRGYVERATRVPFLPAES